MKLMLAVILAASPGLIHWWLGRRLLATHDDATLPERLLHLRSSIAFPICLALIGSAVLAWEQMPWLFLVMVVAILAGGFKVRKTLYQESWSLAAYLSFMLRLWLGFRGFWVLLAVTPLLIQMADGKTFAPLWDNGYWPATIVLAAILVLWGHFHSRIMLALLRCVPLEGAALEPYRAALARIDEQTQVATPSQWLLPMAGGRWGNAVALPSTTKPRVLFASSLLDALEPDEVGAIYAHEMGHHEYYTRARLHQLQLLEIALILLAVLAAPLTDFAWLWPLVVIVAFRWISRRRQIRETDADLRALELCGDAEGLIRALTKIHQLAMLPRRVALKLERAQSHPSLARRIQTIRQAAQQATASAPATDTDGDTGAALLPLATLPLTLRGAEAGTAVVVGHDSVSWLEGVDAEAIEEEAIDPQALLAAARANRTVTYHGLAELRVDRGLKGPPVLETQEVDGQKRSFKLPVEGTAQLQRALDQVDGRLATELTRKGKKSRQAVPRETVRATFLWILIFGITVTVWLFIKS